MDGANRPRVAFFPDRIVGRQLRVDDGGMGLERPNVKGQHPPKIARGMPRYNPLELLRLGLSRGEGRPYLALRTSVSAKKNLASREAFSSLSLA